MTESKERWRSDNGSLTANLQLELATCRTGGRSGGRGDDWHMGYIGATFFTVTVSRLRSPADQFNPEVTFEPQIRLWPTSPQ
jgi:hypothetical protein